MRGYDPVMRDDDETLLPPLAEGEPELLDENDEPIEGQAAATADLLTEETLGVEEI